MAKYYHGGAPGLRPHRPIRPAAARGLRFSYGNMAFGTVPKYDPNRVYVTTHLGVARSYAARYMAPGQGGIPGDVYEVEPISTPEHDPDYGPDVDVMWMCREARIVRIVERGVELSIRQQCEVAWPYSFRTDDGGCWSAEDGTMIPTSEMLAEGVTSEYADLLPKWITPMEVDRRGTLTVPQPPGIRVPPCTPAQVIDILAHLGLDTSEDHLISVMGSDPVCSCGATFESAAGAASHQIGPGGEADLIARHNSDGDIAPFANEFQQRHPDRWQWLGIRDWRPQR